MAPEDKERNVLYVQDVLSISYITSNFAIYKKTIDVIWRLIDINKNMADKRRRGLWYSRQTLLYIDLELYLWQVTSTLY